MGSVDTNDFSCSGPAGCFMLTRSNNVVTDEAPGVPHLRCMRNNGSMITSLQSQEDWRFRKVDSNINYCTVLVDINIILLVEGMIRSLVISYLTITN
jgi:hypothetical protein